jgi:hypothetical protein
VIACTPERINDVETFCARQDVPVRRLGRAEGTSVVFGSEASVRLDLLSRTSDSALNGAT